MDINKLNICWGGPGFAEYAGECKSGEGTAEKEARMQNSADRTSRDRQIGMSDANLADLEGGSVQDTNYYKRNVTSATDDTSAAYDNVRARRMAAARRAGFGYTQPVTQGDQASVDASEARDLGKIPIDVANDTQALRMQAAGIHSGEAGMYNTSQMNALNTQATAEEKRKARMQSMWGGIAKLGVRAGAAFATGGMSEVGNVLKG